MAGNGKKTRGRQKIDLKKIEVEDTRQVTFSKRRSGIYKKANELVSSCGAEVGVIVFSPKGKPLSFGCPSVEAITNRFLNRNLGPNEDGRLKGVFNAHDKMRMTVMTWAFSDFLTRLSDAKEEGEALKKITRAIREGVPDKWEEGWWEKSPGDLQLEELKEYMAKLEVIHEEVNDHLNQRLGHVAAPGPADPVDEDVAMNDQAGEGEEGRADPSGENIQDGHISENP